ncbi:MULTISPECIES: acyl dehydratase [Bacillus]
MFGRQAHCHIENFYLEKVKKGVQVTSFIPNLQNKRW